MPQAIELTSNGGANSVRATVSVIGGALKSLVVGDTQLVGLTDNRLTSQFDGVVLAPWANRIDRGRWNYLGKELQLEANDKAFDNALHGLVTELIFDVVEQTDHSVKLQTRVDSSPGYPFDLEILVSYELTNSGIRVTHSAKNVGDNAAPYVVGAHPYFQISGTPIDQLELKLAASTVHVVDDRKIPTGKVEILGTEFDATSWRKLSDCNFDHGFGELLRDANGNGHTYLRSSKGEQLDIWQSPEMQYTFIFTPSQAIAIEPQSAPANAFNSHEDLILLEPGGAHTASWGAELSLNT